MPKILMLIFTVFIFIRLYSQENKQLNLLTLKDSVNYSETNYFCNKSISFEQQIQFNDPSMLDEEYWYFLKVTFNKELCQLSNTILNLNSNLIRCNFYVYSFWDIMCGQADTTYRVTGQIELLEVNRKEITIKENILLINEAENKVLELNGTRVFTRKRKIKH